MGPEPKLEDSPLVIGAIRAAKYDSYFFLFEWTDENTLVINYKYPDELYEEYKDAVKTTIKCN